MINRSNAKWKKYKNQTPPPPPQNSHAELLLLLLLLLSRHGPIMVGPWLSCLCASGRRVPWSQSSDLPRPWHAGSSLHQSSLPGSIHHTHRHCHGVIELAAPAAVASVPYPTIINLLPIRKRSTLTAVGRSQLLARWPGTLFRILPRDPTSSTDCFRRLLKTYLFVQYQCLQHIRGSQRSRTIQIHSLTHLTVVPARDWTTAATQQ